MAQSAALELIIQLKGDADKQVNGLSKSILGLGKSAVGVGATITKAIGGIALGGAIAGVAGLGAAFASGISDAREAAIVFAQTEAVLKSTGGAAGITADQVSDLAASLSAASGMSLFGDDQIQQSTNLLLTFTNLEKGVLEAATAISVDMAQALGGAPADAAVQLGKALNDPIKGISALTRVGVTFSEEQKAVIASLVETGDMAGAQAVIIAELNKEFGGSAAAAAAADGGWAQFRDRMGELAESIGAKALPMLNQLVDVLNSPAVQAGIQAFADGLVTGVGTAFTWLTETAIPTLTAAWQSIQPALVTVGEVITGTIIPAFQQVATFITQNIDLLTTIGAAVAIAVAAFATISTIVSVVGSVAAAFAGMGAAVTTAGSVLGGIVAILGGPVTIAIGAVALAAGLLYAAWTTNFGGIQEKTAAVWSFIQSATAPVLATLSRFATEIQPMMTVAWANIQTVVTTVWNTISSVVTTAAGAILGFITSHMSQIQAVFSGTWTVIQGIVQVAWSLISGIIKTGLAVLSGDWSGAWEAIKATFSGVWEGIKTILSGALTVIKAELSLAWDVIKLAASAAWEALRAAIEAKIGEVVALAQGIAAKVVGALSGLAGELVSIGAAAIQGLINGLKSIDVGSVLGGILRAGIDAAKAAIGSHSPSKLTRDQLGLPMGEGIVVGITSTADAVAAAMASVTTDAVKPLSTRMFAITEAMGKTFGKYVQSVMKDGDVLNKYLSDLPDALEDGVRELGQALAGASGDFAEWLTNMSKEANNAQAVLRVLQGEMFGIVTGGGGARFGMVGENHPFIQQLKRIALEAGGAGEGIADAIKTGIADGLEKPENVKQILGGKLRNAVELAAENVKQILGGKLRDGGAAAMGEFGKGLEEGWDKVKQIFGGKLRELEDPATTAGENAAKALIDGFSRIMDDFDFGEGFGGGGTVFKPGPGGPRPPTDPAKGEKVIAQSLSSAGDVAGLSFASSFLSTAEDIFTRSQLGDILTDAATKGPQEALDELVHKAQAIQARMDLIRTTGNAEDQKRLAKLDEDLYEAQKKADAAMAGLEGAVTRGLADLGNAFGSIGTTIGNYGLRPLNSNVARIADELKAVDDEIADAAERSRFVYTTADAENLARLEERRAQLVQEQTGATEEQLALQKQLLALEEQRQKFGFLGEQQKLLDLIDKYKLNPADILGGMTLGLDASIGGITEAMTRALAAIVAQINARIGTVPVTGPVPPAQTNTWATMPNMLTMPNLAPQLQPISSLPDWARAPMTVTITFEKGANVMQPGEDADQFAERVVDRALAKLDRREWLAGNR